MAQQEKLSKFEFQKRFASEGACEEQLFRMKWPSGYRCERCGCVHHYTTATRKLTLYQCRECGYQATVIVNTIMEKTRTELGKWFLAVYSMAADKTMVLVGLSLNDEKHPEYLKMEIINNVKGRTLLDFASEHIEEHSIISSDGYRSYRKLADKYTHIAKEFNPEEDAEHLKWLHVMIANAKAFIVGTFHGLDPKHLQRYLDEFCYRFNRRKFDGQGFLPSSILLYQLLYHYLF